MADLPPVQDVDIDAEIAKLYAPAEEAVPVVLAVHNGAGLVPTGYYATPTTIMEVQALLEVGSSLNVPDVMSRATAAVLAVVRDADLAHDVVAHLVERNLLK